MNRPDFVIQVGARASVAQLLTDLRGMGLKLQPAGRWGFRAVRTTNHRNPPQSAA